MSISPHLMQRIRAQSVALVEDRTGSEETTQVDFAAQAKRITDRVPSIIAQALADGASHAEVMAIRAGVDYTCPTWKETLFSKSPAQSWLKGPAAVVYAWCEESGLQPFFSPYRGNKRGEAGIIISWDAERMKASLNGDGQFVRNLQAVSAEAQARKAAESARDRVRYVRKAITEAHAAINRVSKDGGTEAKVAEAYSGCENPILRGDSWTGDLITYIESLGLKVRTETYKSNDCGPCDTWCSHIYASWEPKSPPSE